MSNLIHSMSPEEEAAFARRARWQQAFDAQYRKHTSRASVSHIPARCPECEDLLWQEGKHIGCVACDWQVSIRRFEIPREEPEPEHSPAAAESMPVTCPRCGGRVFGPADWEACIACGWAGQTRDGREVPVESSRRPVRGGMKI